METTTKLYSYSFKDTKTYIAALLFVAGNILVPQLCHLMPQGGLIWLPIYFFTLVGAYKYGWKVGLLTAIASPLVNSVLFGMPTAHALPPIMIKSVVLAGVASFIAVRSHKATLWMLALAVLSYQIVGTGAEWILKGNLWAALQDFRIGLPGMLVQILGGYLFINYLIRR